MIVEGKITASDEKIIRLVIAGLYLFGAIYFFKKYQGAFFSKGAYEYIVIFYIIVGVLSLLPLFFLNRETALIFFAKKSILYVSLIIIISFHALICIMFFNIQGVAYVVASFICNIVMQIPLIYMVKNKHNASLKRDSVLLRG